MRGSETPAPFDVLAALVASAMLAAPTVHAQSSGGELAVLPVQGNVYMLYGGEAGNLAVQIGEDGVIVVNALRAGMAEQVAAQVATLTPAPIRYIVNTSADLHNVGGNAALAALGAFGASNAGGRTGATLVAHENVMLRLTQLSRATRDPFPGEGIPHDAYILSFKDIYFNDEPVFVMHEPNAHSDGDSIVLFRKSDVIAVGDLFTVGEYPVIDVERGGSVHGLLRALNHILELAVPERLQDGGTRIVPGRGRLCNEADVVEYRDMVAIVRDRVRASIAEGMTLAQIQSTRPALDYETQYGPGDAFVESVYASLIAEP